MFYKAAKHFLITPEHGIFPEAVTVIARMATLGLCENVPVA